MEQELPVSVARVQALEVMTGLLITAIACAMRVWGPPSRPSLLASTLVLLFGCWFTVMAATDGFNPGAGWHLFGPNVTLAAAFLAAAAYATRAILTRRDTIR